MYNKYIDSELEEWIDVGVDTMDGTIPKTDFKRSYQLKITQEIQLHSVQ